MRAYQIGDVVVVTTDQSSQYPLGLSDEVVPEIGDIAIIFDEGQAQDVFVPRLHGMWRLYDHEMRHATPEEALAAGEFVILP